MKSWVKLYTEINRDPKMIRLSWAQRGIWSALLALAGEIDDQDEDGPTGYVGSAADVALLLRCDDDEFAGAVDAFAERGMVHDDDGAIYLTQFSARQARAPSSQRAAVAQRVKRHRRRKGSDSNDDVTTLHDDVTTTQQGVTPSDTDTDTDADTNTEEMFVSSSVRAFENAIGLIAGTTMDREIKDALGELWERGLTDWWQMALDIACDNNKRSWSYMRGILYNWLKEGKPSIARPKFPVANGPPETRMIEFDDPVTGGRVVKEVPA